MRIIFIALSINKKQYTFVHEQCNVIISGKYKDAARLTGYIALSILLTAAINVALS